MKGIYVLVLLLKKDNEITIGKLGKFHFKSGYYYYAGSALGMGGFKRVSRHFNVAQGKNRTRKWHIDHLLPHSEIVCALLLPTDEALECDVAANLMEHSFPVNGFGCSDCACKSHLFFSRHDILNNISKTASELTGNESIIIYPTI